MRQPAPTVQSVSRALPSHSYSQDELIAAFRDHWSKQHFNIDRLEELHRAVSVGNRHLAVPLKDYLALDTFAKRNDAWIRVACELGEKAVRDALQKANLTADQVDHIYFVTVTGIATPSIDSVLMNRLPFRTDVKRSPLFGLGCVAGAAGLARASDALRAFPDQISLLLSVELCSLTLQREDLSIANIIASGLFGDGACAVVLQGEKRASKGPRILATQSVFYPDSLRIMGWDIGEQGFKVVLSAKVPNLVREHIGKNVGDFLGKHGVSIEQIRHWVAHTGGPKVLEAFQEALHLPEGALNRSWKSLREVGNLSSASVLFVLGDLLESGEAAAGDYGLLLAMGPGFCAELVLMQW